MMATYSGRDVAGVSIILLGGKADLVLRHKQFKQLEAAAAGKGSSSSCVGKQIIGPGPPVVGDDTFCGAAAPVTGGLWELPEFAHSAAMLSLTSMASSYATMLKGDTRKSVHHASNAAASLTTIVEQLEKDHPEWHLENVAELSELVAKSYREYDVEFKKLEDSDAASLERLLAMAECCAAS